MEINSCGAFLSAGLGDCNGRTQPIIGVLISTKNTTYTYAELQTIAKTKTNISLAAGIVSIYVPFRDSITPQTRPMLKPQTQE